MDVLLELADGLCAEGVRYDLPLAGMFCSVSGVEQPAPDGDEGVVELAEATVSIPYLWEG